jgi:hypothetical protein
VSTENTNLSYFSLYFDVLCTAYDRAGHVLDSGLRTDQAIKDGRSLAQDRERNGLLPAGSGKRGDGGYSFIRLKKVLHARLDFLESPSPR